MVSRLFYFSAIHPIISFYGRPRNCGGWLGRFLYMKLFRIVLSSVALPLIASAAPVYKVTLTQPAVVAGSVVKPGDYKIVVNGEKAVLTSGKVTLEVPVKVETGKQKFAHTSVESREEGGKILLEDIQVGGTTTTLIFSR